MNGRTPDRYISLTARHGQRDNTEVAAVLQKYVWYTIQINNTVANCSNNAVITYLMNRVATVFSVQKLLQNF